MSALSTQPEPIGLDYDGRALLSRLQSEYGAEAFLEVPDVAAVDAHGALQVMIDAAQRVIDVRVLDIDRLRTKDALAVAVGQAFIAAVTARLRRSLEASGALRRWQERAEAIRDGLVAIDIGTSPSVIVWDRSGLVEEVAAPSRAREVTSGNGFLTMRRTDFGVTITAVDGTWLSAVSIENLERALLEATRGEAREEGRRA